MKTKYRHRLQRIVLSNRWEKVYYMRNCNWTIIGISKQYFSPKEYEYTISLFGIDIRFWFERKIKKDKK